MMVRKISWTGVIVLLAGFTGWIHYEVKYAMGHSRSSGSLNQLGHIKVDQPAPEFSTHDLDGREVALREFRDQKVVLLDFWATWCGPCRMSMPVLQTLQEELGDRGVQILSVNQGEEPLQVNEFIQKKKYTFRVLLDQDGSVGDKYGVRAIPTMVVVDKRGVVRWIHQGYSPDDGVLKGMLERLVRE